jgi:hypothetical protein
MSRIVRNKLSVSYKNYEKVMDSITERDDNGQRYLDFENIIPMPDSIRETIAGSITDDCMNLFINSIKHSEMFRKYITIVVFNGMSFTTLKDDEYKKLMDKCLAYGTYFTDSSPYFKDEQSVLDYGKRAYDNVFEYGAKDWLEWALNNWGVKSNAVTLNQNANVVEFETEDNGVAELISKLSEQFPECDFKYEFADEILYENAGEYEFRNGEIINEKQFISFSKQIYEFGFEMWPEYKNRYYYDKKTKSYIMADKEEDSEM